MLQKPFNGEQQGSNYRVCTQCKLSKLLSQFERTGKYKGIEAERYLNAGRRVIHERAEVCRVCNPSELFKYKMEYLHLRRLTGECAKCNESPVYWYRADGKLCDVFRFVEEDYSLPYIKRFMGQLTPKCEKCAVIPKLSKLEQVLKQADGYRGRAIVEKDEEKQSEYWRLHFALTSKAKGMQEAEANNEEYEEPVAETTSWYGGTEDM